MSSRLAWRGSATAAGVYLAALLGFLATVVAAHVLSLHEFAVFTLAVAAALFFQLLFDLTTEEAVVKFGFRYVEGGDWGRLRRLLEVGLGVKTLGALLAGGAVAGLAPLAGRLFDIEDLTVPLLLVALLPLAQVPQGLALTLPVLHGRYELRAWLDALVMALRLVAVVIGAPFGVTAAVGALLVAQVVASAVTGAVGLVAYRRFPRATAVPLGADAAGVRRFVLQSSIGTGIDSARGMLAPLVLGVVATTPQVAWFRAAQAPQAGFATLSAPVRLILLTEQTRDVERGDVARIGWMLRRYVTGATGLMLLLVPLLLWLMPDLIAFVYPDSFAPAVDAARLVLLAAAVQVVFGWTKSFPVSIGRPSLRIVAHGVEAAVLVPCLLVFGAKWGATGAGAAVLVSVLAFALVWVVLIVRLRREGIGGPSAAAVRAQEASAP